MDKLMEIWNTVCFYAVLFFGYVSEGVKYIARSIYTYIEAVFIPAMPTVLKMFSNRTVNLILFIVIVGFFLVINIVTLCMFGSDKGKAKKNRYRISEGKLLKMCFFGGAIGGFIGMLCFNHKTRKMKFYIFVPLMFIIQVILQSFIIGFLGFWAFFY